MFWPSWTLRLLPPKSPHQPRIAGIRRACASRGSPGQATYVPFRRACCGRAWARCQAGGGAGG
jgi:hypothetical protein